MPELLDSIKISASGMRAQGERVLVISENIANTDSLATLPGGDPYRRKVISFKNTLDRELGVHQVKVNNIRPDMSEFGKKFMPSHPGADDQGYVLTPNLNPLFEMMDMRQAQRSYEANLNAITVSKSMIQRTIDMIR